MSDSNNLPNARIISLRANNESFSRLGLKKSSVRIYENEIPPFAARELERLYENFYSSFYGFGLTGEPGNTSTYVVQENGEISTLLLFTQEDGVVRVLNELIGISGEGISRFAEHVFARFPDAAAIVFHAIETPALKLPYPFQQFEYTEDIVLPLPESVEEYQTHLGKSTRKTINENMNKLKRSFPSFDFQVYEKDAAKEEQIRSLIRFNRERMSGKGKAPGTEEEEARHIHDLVKACGLVFIARAEDRICAGQVCFQVGGNYFSLLNAHSPEFNQYRLGTLCNYLSICECIERGGKEFHFLWGREEFKYRFLGEQRNFDELVIYRSPLHMALNSGLALKTAIEGRKRQARMWLLDPKRKDHAAIKFAKNMVKHLRH